MTCGWSGAWAELRAVDTAARAMVPGFVDLGAVSALPSPAFGKLVLDVRPPVAYGSERLTSTARDGWVGRTPVLSRHGLWAQADARFAQGER